MINPSSSVNWLECIKKAKKTSISQNNLKKVHYEFANGTEMVEEYNMDTHILTRRAWKTKTNIGEEDWSIEIGDPEPQIFKREYLIKENTNEPVISRRITKRNLEWRIRNLPYPVETYSVTADTENKCLTVRTTNKKYFKKLQIPELDRVNLLPEQKFVQFTHKYNTLIITYTKPVEVLNLERLIFEEIQNVPSKNDGDINSCKPS